MSKLFFQTPGASNPSSHARSVSTNHNYPKSFTKLVAGTKTIFTLGKQSEDFTHDRKTEHDHSSAIADHVKMGPF